jgi:hypothetical protein
LLGSLTPLFFEYTSVDFGMRLKEAGLLPSMGSVADDYDDGRTRW